MDADTQRFCDPRLQEGGRRSGPGRRDFALKIDQKRRVQMNHNVGADRQAILSKYATEYARHAATASASGGLPGGLEAGVRLESRWPAGRAAYTLVDARVTRRVGPVTLVVEGTNLLDAEYQEVAGVAMPGRAFLAGLGWSARPAP